MGDETKTQPRTIQSRVAAGKLGGRPKACVPSREMVLKELWGTKKITVARVKALGLLLAELKETPAIAATNHGSPVVALPAWMQDDEKAAE